MRVPETTAATSIALLMAVALSPAPARAAAAPEAAQETTPPTGDEHAAFFAAANPGYLDGDELVCVARIEPDNFSAALRRLAP